MKIYLDDDRENRRPPDGSWTRVFGPEEFRALIQKCVAENILVEAISFDNDLGVVGLENEGHGLLKWLAENYPEYVAGGKTEITVHSANETARREMLAKLESYREHKEELLSAHERPHPFGEIVR